MATGISQPLFAEFSVICNLNVHTTSVFPAWLGLKAPALAWPEPALAWPEPALAWPEPALAFSNLRPSQSRRTGY
jgi:hypothetical protein